jgi:hypothetical protein
MCECFNILTLSLVPTECTCMFRKVLTTNRVYKSINVFREI